MNIKKIWMRFRLAFWGVLLACAGLILTTGTLRRKRASKRVQAASGRVEAMSLKAQALKIRDGANRRSVDKAYRDMVAHTERTQREADKLNERIDAREKRIEELTRRIDAARGD